MSLVPIGEVIHPQLKGKEVAEVLRDGHFLRLRMTNGQEFCIGWRDENGDPVKGFPHLDRVDVRLIMPSAGAAGTARR